MDPIDLSLFVNRLQAACEEMGATLRRAAFSPNIKDRLDFSCAIFDQSGALCAQAAHIPVHLGSMAYAMHDIVADFDWHEGDMVIVNDPFLGGTHLPDVTLIAPLFVAGEIVAFCANRAHHADIGCAQPGSMPLARRLEEEGLVIAPRHYLRAGVTDPATASLLAAGLRNPDLTLGDFAAQVSANRLGLERLRHLVSSTGTTAFAAALAAVNDYARTLATSTLAALPRGHYYAEDVMDGDGFSDAPVRIAVTVTLAGDRAIVDFSGTAPMVAGNINCPLSVTAAAVYYTFYALMPAGTPACAGSLAPLELRVPDGCLLHATAPAAVAAGNVETSQRIVDVLLAALAGAAPRRAPAASQGTMNNLAMGDKTWDYYETVGGGSGAHAQAGGLDAVQTHMTNTLNTPVEVLEMNYPLQITRYAIRRGSGGAGRHAGGDGIIRDYRFLAPATLTVLSERRAVAPPGLAGGDAAQPGINRLNGQSMPGKFSARVQAGDTLSVATPGGGGWGDPAAAPADT